MPTVHLIIKGKVQGVFYRATAKKVADEIGVKGWVKNSGGNVEAVAAGNNKQIQTFISWCKKGSPQAIVTDVGVTEIEDVMFDYFEIVTSSKS